jgi:hypothetical protein
VGFFLQIAFDIVGHTFDVLDGIRGIAIYWLRVSKGSDPPATPWNRAIWIPPPEPAYRLFFAGAEMAKRERWQCIPTELNLERFREFVLPHLSVGSRGRPRSFRCTCSSITY